MVSPRAFAAGTRTIASSPSPCPNRDSSPLAEGELKDLATFELHAPADADLFHL